MKIRTAVFVTLALAVVAVVVAVIIGQLPRDGSAPAGGAASGAPNSAESPSPTAASNEPVPGESSNPGPGEGGQEENQSKGESGSPKPPGAAPAKPLISAPLPASASGSGVIVKGFPTAVISLTPGSTVISSSVASGSDRVQVGLSARSTIAPTKVLEYYEAAFAKLGLVASSVPSADGSTAKAFVRGPSTITVTVSSASGGSRYTVFAVLVAAV